MAGGMGKRNDWGPMTDRIARTAAHEAQHRADLAAAVPAPPATLKHCWITDRHGRLPALLLEWRRIDTGAAGAWEGRVIRAVHADDGQWEVVEEWMPAGLLDPA